MVQGDFDGSPDWGPCSGDSCSSKSELWIFLQGHLGILLVVLIMAILIIGGWMYWRKKRTIRKRNEVQRLIEIGVDIKEYDISVIKKATNNFNPKCRIGIGAQGDVFKGKLFGGVKVAVKRLFVMDDYSKFSDFRREITILSLIRHRHIVGLLGCSYAARRQPILIYEYMDKGDLHTLIHDNNGSNPFNWSKRYDIALSIAEAVAHLHFHNIFHRDITSRNVLLDKNFQAKLGDFGISKLSSLETATGYQLGNTLSVIRGTPGYTCPEYRNGGMYTARCDVYSYGVLLAEILTRRKAAFVAEENGEMIFLGPYFAREAATNLEGILDEQLRSEVAAGGDDSTILDEIRGVSSIICSCVAVSKKNRPTMVTVLKDLQELKKTTPSEIDGGHEDDEIYNNNSDDADTAAIWNRESDV